MRILLFMLVATFIVGCTSDVVDPPNDLTVQNLAITLSEVPTNGQTIGSIVASASESISFEIINQNPSGAFTIDANTGLVTVADATLFDFNSIDQLTAQVRVTSGSLSKTAEILVILDIDSENGAAVRTIWTGSTITFTKEAGSDPNDAANQDRITDEVWITRANSGGEIYNAKTESNSSKGISPAGTEWAEGTLDNIDNLTFQSFRNTIKPKQVVGKELVLHLIKENIYLSVKFTAWSSSKSGGFAYERSTPN